MASTEKPIHVAVAVIENKQNRFLLSKRKQHQDLAGLWEFPGGKVEPGESVKQALDRELNEELGIKVVSARPLIKIKHHYPSKSVLLDVWKINQYQGIESGREGQEISWQDISEMDIRQFPEANAGILSAIRFPASYFITPDPYEFSNDTEFLQRIECILSSGCRLIQFRCKQKNFSLYQVLLQQVQKLTARYEAQCILNGSAEDLNKLNLDGIHLGADKLLKHTERPVSKNKILAASCHNEAEIKHANKIDVDFIVLGSVLKTASHPNQTAMGWNEFSRLTQLGNKPAYAIGGMKQEFLETCWFHGGHGIASISDLWNKAESLKPYEIS